MLKVRRDGNVDLRAAAAGEERTAMVGSKMRQESDRHGSRKLCELTHLEGINTGGNLTFSS
jgi:hypothetical protein